MTITINELDDLEVFAQNLFFNVESEKKMTFHFTNHFSGERINDARNNPLITIIELKDVLTKFRNKYIKALYRLSDGQSYVVKCRISKINIVFSIEEEKIDNTNYHKNIAITVMRKKEWKSRSGDIAFSI